MGPKKHTAAGTLKGREALGKRARTSATASYDSSRFLSAENQERFETQFRGKNIITERAFDYDNIFYNKSIERVVERRKWKTLVTFASDSSSQIMGEFYSNADLNTVRRTRKTWVRGKVVRFDAAFIESFLQTSYNRSEPCEFDRIYKLMQPTVAKNMYSEHMPEWADKIREGITSPHATWKNKTGQRPVPEKLVRLDLTGDAITWHAFVNATVMPSTNKSDVNVERAALYYVLLGDGNLDISSLLSDRILQIMTRGQSRFWLAHSSLIHHLCIKAGVEIPEDEPLDVKVCPPITYQTIRGWFDESTKHAIWLRRHRRTRPPSPSPGPSPDRHDHTAPSSSSSRPEHIPLYEDSPSYLLMQSQVRYTMQMMEDACRQMGIDTTHYRPSFPAPEEVDPPAADDEEPLMHD